MLTFVDHQKPERDVVVTGIGLVTPLALDRERSWQRLLAGDRAARPLTSEHIDHLTGLQQLPGLQLSGAPVDHPAVRARLREWPGLTSLPQWLQTAWTEEPVVAMTLLALREAADHAGLKLPLPDTTRAACCVGASKGGLRTAESLCRLSSGGGSGADRTAPVNDSDTDGHRWWHAFQVDAATRAVTAIAGVQQFQTCPVAACATGLISLIQAAAAISSGQCDLCLAGSADAALRASVLAAFHRLRVTSRYPEPAAACRPFDQHRDGFVVGEGAAVLILESRAHACQRNAPIWARMTAGGWLSDPTGMTQIDTSGDTVAELLRRTLAAVPAAGHSPGLSTPVDYVNLHGTGTESNDLAEARGLARAFPEVRPWCSGVKGAIGHLLGGAGSVESALTLLALRDGVLPTTTNLTQPDPRCPIPLIQGQSQRRPIRRAVKLSLGFGGHVACGVFDAEPGIDATL